MYIDVQYTNIIHRTIVGIPPPCTLPIHASDHIHTVFELLEINFVAADVCVDTLKYSLNQYRDVNVVWNTSTINAVIRYSQITHIEIRATNCRQCGIAANSSRTASMYIFRFIVLIYTVSSVTGCRDLLFFVGYMLFVLFFTPQKQK